MKVVVAHLINEPFQDTFIARKKWNRKKKKRKKKKTKNEQQKEKNEKEKKKEKNEKRTAPGLHTWSPTVLLAGLEGA